MAEINCFPMTSMMIFFCVFPMGYAILIALFFNWSYNIYWVKHFTIS